MEVLSLLQNKTKKIVQRFFKKRGYRVVPIPRSASSVGAGKAKKLIYLHVPKTGGTFLHALLDDQFEFSYRVSSHESKRVADELGVPMQEVRELLLQSAGYQSYSYISGHVKVFEQLWRLQEKLDYELMTLLRDPVDRFFSHYFYNRYCDNDHFSHNKSFEEVVNSQYGHQVGQLYVNFFSDIAHDAKLEDRIKNAAENIKRLNHVGWLENVDSFIQEDLAAFIDDGVDAAQYRTNSNPAPREMYEEYKNNDAYVSQVRELCQPDVELLNTI